MIVTFICALFIQLNELQDEKSLSIESSLWLTILLSIFLNIFISMLINIMDLLIKLIRMGYFFIRGRFWSTEKKERKVQLRKIKNKKNKRRIYLNRGRMNGLKKNFEFTYLRKKIIRPNQMRIAKFRSNKFFLKREKSEKK